MMDCILDRRELTSESLSLEFVWNKVPLFLANSRDCFVVDITAESRRGISPYGIDHERSVQDETQTPIDN
jgi:hypothetical protein